MNTDIQSAYTRDKNCVTAAILLFFNCESGPRKKGVKRRARQESIAHNINPCVFIFIESLPPSAAAAFFYFIWKRLDESVFGSRRAHI